MQQSDQLTFIINQINKNNEKVILIVGPTSSGKSSLAFELTRHFPSNILVADSRQVYKDIPITSGADIPSQFTPANEDGLQFFKDEKTELFGTTFLDSNETWSVGAFYKLAQQVITRTFSQNKKLIIVGGTGLYTHALLFPENYVFQPATNQLREQLQVLSLTELQAQLSKIDPNINEKMNQSDWNNPRRLIRAIEISQTSSTEKLDLNDLPNEIKLPDGKSTTQPKWFGVTIDKDQLQENIRTRVIQRIEDGAVEEVEHLMNTVDQKDLSIFSATGVKEIMGYINEQYDRVELIELWTRRELQYAKRQMTWFKKRDYIQWVSE